MRTALLILLASCGLCFSGVVNQNRQLAFFAGAPSVGPACTGTGIGDPEAVLSVTLNSLDSSSGKHGMKFTVGSADIVVTAISRYKVLGNSGTHLIHLRNSSCTDLAVAAVDMNTGAVSNSWISGCVPATTLTAGQTYYVLDENNGGADQYWSNSPVTFSSDIASMTEASDTGSGCTTGTANGDDGPVSIQYHLASGCTPSYANTGGTGDRSAIITVVDSSTTGSSIVGGSGGSQSWVNNAALATGQSFFNGATGDGSQYWIRFDFLVGHSALITESKFYQGDATSQGTWKWQGSNVASPNTTTDWTDIGGNFTLVTAATTTSTSMSANATYYRYYRLLFMSGTTSGGPWTFQMEFKLCYQ